MSVATFAQRLWRGELGAAGYAVSALLLPAELLYRAGAIGYHGAWTSGLLKPVRVPVSVISVGNLTVGGAGKTPVTRWLAGRLLARGRRPGILHGGYASDEPALHREWLPSVPVVALRDRVRGARQAIAAGADVLVLDDAFQHRRLARDLDVVLVAAETWEPRPRLLPRGGWRETPHALARAGLVLVTRKTASETRAQEVLGAIREAWPDAAAARLDLLPAGWRDGRTGAAAAAPASAVAVTALAEPRAFLENARAAGAGVEDDRFFADHHEYTAADAAAIREWARGRVIVTTEKDWVKLRRHAVTDVRVLEQQVRVAEGGDAIERALDEALP